MDNAITTMEVDAPAAVDGPAPQRPHTKPYIENLYSNDPKKCFHGVVELKFAVIGSPRSKASVIEQGCVARLLQILRAPDSGLLLKTEVVTVLNSLAKGLPEHAASLVQAGVLPVLWEQLEACGQSNILSNTSQYVTKVTFSSNTAPSSNSANSSSADTQEPASPSSSDSTNNNNSAGTSSAAVAGTSSFGASSSSAGISDTNASTVTTSSALQQQQHHKKLLRIISNYTQMLLCCLRSVYRQGCVPPPPSWNHKLLSTLIKYGYHPPMNQECVANILAYACKCEEQQTQLVEAGAGSLVAAMLSSSLTTVQLPALHCLNALARNNSDVSERLCLTEYGGSTVPDRLVCLLDRHAEPPVQLGAATALVWLHRGGALAHNDTRVCHRTLQCLVRLCAPDRPAWLRVESARQLAHLTELSPELQGIAAITDHLIPSMGEFLDYKPLETEPQPRPEQLSPNSCGKYDDVSLLPNLMCEAGLLVYSSLAANTEEIRHKIANQTVLETIDRTLASGTPAVKLAAIRCLHSLSRSVHMLRTTYKDHEAWKPLLDLVHDPKADDEMVVLALSTLCNLILEFSSCKEDILAQGFVSHLCSMTKRENYDVKLNAVWALMNVAYQADFTVKESILQHLGTEQMFSLISEGDAQVVMKTLGLLRNLLSNKLHIDSIMRQHGNQIMQSVILILEGQYNSQVKEQALCVLANIADGEQAKEFIVGNEDVLKKLFNYMVMPKLELQLASTCCIGNLAASDDPNAKSHQERLREMKTEKVLNSLLGSQNTTLFEKVRHALQQFTNLDKATASSSSSSNSSSSSSSSTNGSSSASSTPASHWRPLDQGP